MLRKHMAAFSVLLVVTSAVCWPFLRDIGNANANDDWLMRAARHAAWRRAVLEQHQLPLRSPYFGGGYPTMADPEDPFLSPSLLATLCLGEVAGPKVVAFGFYLAAGLGMYYLAFAVLGHGHLGALWAALLFALCGLLPSRHFSGNIEELQYGLIPLVVALFIQTRAAWQVVGCRLSVVGDGAELPSPKTKNREPKTPAFPRLGLLILLLLAMMMDGKLCWVSLVLFLFVFSVVYGLRRDGPRLLFDGGWLRNLALVLAAVALLGMARILPVAEFFGGDSGVRLAMRANTYSPVTIRAHSATSLALGLTWPLVDPSSFAMSGLFFGPVALAAFLVCALARLRDFGRWLVLLGVFLWLSMAHNAPVDLFRVLQKLPVFSSMSMPAKYFDPFLAFIVCVIAGRLPTLLSEWLTPRKAVATAILVAILSLWPLTKVAWMVHDMTYPSPVTELKAEAEFFHVRGVSGMRRSGARTPHASAYFNVRRNVGTIDSMLPLRVSEKAIPRCFVDRGDRQWPNSAYQGEAWAQDAANTVRLTAFTPNRIELQASLRTPDTLIVNQNYQQGWRASRGRVTAAQGLLALELPEPGEQAVTLRYRPPSFMLGLCVSVLSVAAVVLIGWLRRHRASESQISDFRSQVENRKSKIENHSRVFDVTWLRSWPGALLLVAAGAAWAFGLKPSYRADDLFFAGQQLLARDDAAGAMEKFAQAIAADPQHVAAHYELGKLHYRKGAPAAAVGALEQAIAADPSNSFAHSYLALSLAALGRPEEAVRECQKAIEIEPYDMTNFAELAGYLAALKRTDEAIAAMQRAVEIGFEDLHGMETSAALAPLRADARFQALIQEVRRRHEEWSRPYAHTVFDDDERPR